MNQDLELFTAPCSDGEYIKLLPEALPARTAGEWGRKNAESAIENGSQQNRLFHMSQDEVAHQLTGQPISQFSENMRTKYSKLIKIPR